MPFLATKGKVWQQAVIHQVVTESSKTVVLYPSSMKILYSHVYRLPSNAYDANARPSPAWEGLKIWGKLTLHTVLHQSSPSCCCFYRESPSFLLHEVCHSLIIHLIQFEFFSALGKTAVLGGDSKSLEADSFSVSAWRPWKPQNGIFQKQKILDRLQIESYSAAVNLHNKKYKPMKKSLKLLSYC